MALLGNLRHRPVRRLVQLYLGLTLYGVSMALMIRSDLGLDPWDVFHQGLSELTRLSFGTVTIGVGALVLLLWIPLRQRPGLGTVSNVVVIGLVVDATVALLPEGGPRSVRIAMLISGIVANGAATALYLGAQLGPGPRDGLMTGYVARRPGRSVRLVRTVIEVTVLALGWLLGGTVGVGTVAYALAIGPLAQFFIPLFAVPEAPAPESAVPEGGTPDSPAPPPGSPAPVTPAG
ncbi:membrane protein YczE [Micromonospora sp. SD19]|uniref:YitT family protein n=1 Tax=Micromonospora parva TaxID=1464048 RepID=A0ABW6W0N1_9ACTN